MFPEVKHLMTGLKGNSEFCFPETLKVPRGEVFLYLPTQNRTIHEFQLTTLFQCRLNNHDFDFLFYETFNCLQLLTHYLFENKKKYEKQRDFWDNIFTLTGILNFLPVKNASYYIHTEIYSKINCQIKIVRFKL